MPHLWAVGRESKVLVGYSHSEDGCMATSVRLVR